MTRKAKTPTPARLEGAEPDSDLVYRYPKAAAVSRGPLGDIVETFKAMHPAEWEACKLWPTQSGIAHMIEVLDA